MSRLSDDLYGAMRGKGIWKFKQLLDRGLDALATYDGETPLHHASLFLRPDIARLLLKHGADVNAKNHAGLTPIEVMPENRMGNGYARGLDLVRLLLEHKADLNPSRIFWCKMTLLHWALEGSGQYPMDAKNGVYENSLAVVRMLIERGADTEATDKFGFSPLEYAITHGHDGVLRLLLEKGVDCSRLMKCGETPLELGIEYHGDDSKIAKIIREHSSRFVH